MMATTYYAVVTEQGNAKIANAVLMGTKVNITEFAVGTGGGAYYAPTGKEAALIDEKWRGSIEEYGTDALNENVLKITAIVPSSVGGFTVREMGVFDEEGILIAIANCPPMEKIVLGDGIVSELVPTIKIAVSNTAVINFKVDPTAIIAIKADISAAVSDVKAWVRGTFYNPNLLIDGDFQVWLKGVGLTGTSSKLFWQLVGGWFCYAATSSNIFEKVTNGIKLTTMTAGYSARLGQYIKYNKNLAGKTVTITVKASSMIGTLQIYQTDNGTNTYLGQLSVDGVKSITCTYPTGAANCGIFVQTSGAVGDTATIEWVKLELGSVATPFVPKPYAIELQDCLMYDADGVIIPPYGKKNFIINSTLTNPINQRGQTTYSIANGSIYTVDRWKLVSWDTSSATLVIDGGLLVSYSGAYKADIRQIISAVNTTPLHNKQMTLSFEIEILSGSLTSVAVGQRESPYTSYIYSGAITASGTYSFTGTIGTPERLILVFTTANGVTTSFRLKWVKLELGLVATPFEPEFYDDELRNCQWYGINVGAGYTPLRLDKYDANTLEFVLPLPQMRVNPSADTSYLSIRQPGLTTSITGFTYSIGTQPGSLKIKATKTAHGLTDAYLVVGATTFFDAEES